MLKKAKRKKLWYGLLTLLGCAVGPVISTGLQTDLYVKGIEAKLTIAGFAMVAFLVYIFRSFIRERIGKMPMGILRSILDIVSRLVLPIALLVPFEVLNGMNIQTTKFFLPALISFTIGLLFKQGFDYWDREVYEIQLFKRRGINVENETI